MEEAVGAVVEQTVVALLLFFWATRANARAASRAGLVIFRLISSGKNVSLLALFEGAEGFNEWVEAVEVPV
jgi:hypothetical protein